MLFSLLNRNSASAFASSVFPTPVVPRKINEPIGRFVSCSPARLRRIALETAAIASSWPTTRLWSSASRLSSFSLSLCSILLTGIPVQRETTSAISSASTSSFTSAESFCSTVSFSFNSTMVFSSSGIRP